MGTGTELKDKRKYEQGDDIRLVDWNVYARTDKLHIKRFEEEKNLTTHIIIDYSKSMNFGKKHTKFDYGSMIGIGFAYLALKNNDRFEFSTFSDDLNLVKARRGVKQLASIVDYFNKLKIKGSSKFEENMTQYRKSIKSKSMVVIISDFLFDIDEIKNGIYNFKNHDLKVIQVLDKEEKDLNIEGDVKLKDSESDTVLRTYVSKKLRLEYLEELDDHSAEIQELVQSMGGKFYTATTHDDIFDVFHHLFA
ncbi:Uncharacterised protein [Candidatus Venteria ishoeyi]|uniref:DUF58 domain-containing protein n=2 Tax=Candidatus Venteria ishoeyi TaxID=1899563 RepID=A0A1H6F7X5_9GAMM|nr:Uncharacterised protein [Candidatus Venteria ishoeyi]